MIFSTKLPALSPDDTDRCLKMFGLDLLFGGSQLACCWPVEKKAIQAE